MEVPFISSGAISRAHYALVRNVELASSSSVADHHILAEVESIRHRLAQPNLSLKECRECLVMLLYCMMTITSGFITNGELNFALPQAVNLAEAGRTAQEKRIGYLFCAEMMPRDHELQLMLVNTLRKDLESSTISRMCLALDTLILSSTEDVIPAVQSRLHDLLSHNSIHVRRRALLAFRSLSRHDHEILRGITGKVQKRLKDPDPTVASAALLVCVDLVNTQPSLREKFHIALDELLKSLWPIGRDKAKQLLLSKVLRTLRIVKPSSDGLRIVLEIVRYASVNLAHTLLSDAFQLLSDSSTEAIQRQTSRLSLMTSIRPLLTSRDPNEQYLFLSCLECLDPILWAGTSPDIPAVLEGWEVERIMKLLDSRDGLIRKMTLKILHCVDTNIIESYFLQALKSMHRTLSIQDKNEYTLRLLEIAETQSGEDGELYARYLKDIFLAVEGNAFVDSHPVLEHAVERVLLYIRNAGEMFRIGCATAIIVSVTEETTPLGSTLVVIISALAAEHIDKLAISPADIVRGLARRLSIYPATVQDACLLSMLRIVVQCEEIPPEVVSSVKALGEHAGRHIRRRCDQFVRLTGQKEVLSDIASKARSHSLPDFLEALTVHESSQTTARTPPVRSVPLRSPDATLSRASLPANKLRYAAYEPPQPAPRFRRPSSSQRSINSSSRSATHSDSGRDVVGSRGSSRLSASSERRSSLDELSRTVTAGDLTLAAGDYLQMIAKSTSDHTAASSQEVSEHPKQVEDLSSRVDLIAFDSPFISDPPVSSSPNSEHDFESIWNALEHSNTRGWCELSIDNVIRRLQGLHQPLKVIAVDRPPFQGDLKVLISPEYESLGDSGSGDAALRLRESEEESCLWRLHCEDNQLRTRIKRLLTDV